MTERTTCAIAGQMVAGPGGTLYYPYAGHLGSAPTAPLKTTLKSPVARERCPLATGY